MLVKGFDFFTGLSDHNLAYHFAASGSGSLFGQRWLFIRALAIVVLRFKDVSLLQHGTICKRRSIIYQVADFATRKCLVEALAAAGSLALSFATVDLGKRL